jgi:nitroimidazol reductase NimA-like FMN-containing flavoprotein (pyridoxamine 5'-phosphate oxidase superfamily)
VDGAPDGATVESLGTEECFRLMATHVVGRVAVAEPGSAPVVLPVNFVLVDREIVFRTAYGTVFRNAVLGERPISFQVDEIDLARRAGWSVLVQGRASELGSWEMSQLRLRAWASGPKPHVVRLVPELVTGRRLHPQELARWSADEGYL